MVVRTDGSSSTISSFCIRSNEGLQYDGKARALSWHAGNFHPPAVVGHNLFHDGKSDAGSNLSGCFCPFGPVEFLENIFEFLLIHADALVAHGPAQFAAV